MGWLTNHDLGCTEDNGQGTRTQPSSSVQFPSRYYCPNKDSESKTLKTAKDDHTNNGSEEETEETAEENQLNNRTEDCKKTVKGRDRYSLHRRLVKQLVDFNILPTAQGHLRMKKDYGPKKESGDWIQRK